MPSLAHLPKLRLYTNTRLQSGGLAPRTDSMHHLITKGMGQNNNRYHRARGQEGKKARSKVYKIYVISCKLVTYLLYPLFFTSCPPAFLPSCPFLSHPRASSHLRSHLGAVTPHLLLFVLMLVLTSLPSISQETGRLSGNFMLNAQVYRPDSLIGAPKVDEKLLSNSYANFRYDVGKFSAGLRYEGYLNTLQGLDSHYDGVGVPYLFADYQTEDLGFTVGSFYEQFGSGILLRAWEDKDLGVDNSLNGVRVRSTPVAGVRITGLVGKQRNFFGFGDGLVRAIDGDVSMNELISAWNEKSTRITFGGSFVSKYQKDEDPIYKLPENVGAWAPRIQVNRGGFVLGAEYARKINDPSSDNNYIYKNGDALLLNASYSVNRLGINLSAKRVDNMSFRSDRTENLNKLKINYLPAISKNQIYSLMNIYPYSSQPNGEMGLQAEISYQVKKGSKIGGKYGTQIALNFSAANSIVKSPLNDSIPVGTTGTMGYTTDFFKVGPEVYFRDLNLEISRKFSPKFKAILIGQHLVYNQAVLEGKGGMVSGNVAIADLTFKPTPEQAVRVEMQGLWTKQDKGNWAMVMAEYSISPHWFFAITDQWNYGNPDAHKRVHYLYGSIAYARNANRIQLSYGKQREGILCVGGVCRNVPAMNGLTVIITSSF